MARKKDRPDNWTHLMNHTGKPLRLRKCTLMLAFFLLAGTETPTTELIGLKYMLFKSPERMERFKNEMRSAFAKPDEMTMIGLSQLNYLNTCLKEGLSMFLPVPIGLERKVPEGRAKVCGNWISGGVNCDKPSLVSTCYHCQTSLLLPHFAAYHSSANLKKPDEFIPERWLPEGEEECPDDKKDTVQLFLHGPKNCLGKKQATQSLLYRSARQFPTLINACSQFGVP